MASLYKLRDLPKEGDYFLLFDDLLKVIRDAFIKYKFSFKTSHKDLKRAWYYYNNKDCPWKVIAYLNTDNKNEVIVNLVISDHMCVSDVITQRGAANCQE